MAAQFSREHKVLIVTPILAGGQFPFRLLRLNPAQRTQHIVRYHEYALLIVLQRSKFILTTYLALFLQLTVNTDSLSHYVLLPELTSFCKWNMLAVDALNLNLLGLLVEQENRK